MQYTILAYTGRMIKRLLLKCWKVAFTLCFIAAPLAVCLYGGSIYYLFFYEKTLPDVEMLRTYRPNSITTISDRTGKKIAEWYRERRIPVTLDDVPDVLVHAILSAEDKNFFSHSGVDWLALVRAAIKDTEFRVTGRKRLQGASTITQQLARLVFLNPADRSLERKIHELWLSWNIEHLFSKREILTLYINQVYLGEGQYGFAAAADYYFKKELKDLSTYEAAVLAGSIVSPNVLSPRNHPEEAKVRRDEILRRMIRNGYIDEEEYAILTEMPIRVADKTNTSIAPHALEYIKKDLVKKGIPRDLPWRGALEIRTTLDSSLQHAARVAAREGIAEYEQRNGSKLYNPLEVCLMVIEHSTGQIVAYVGGRDFEHNKFDHCSQSRRQPGSTFKTFVLAAALEQKRKEPWTLDSIVDDSPRCYGSRQKPYCPKNYAGFKNRYAGRIPLRKAFAESRNAAFIWLGNKIGANQIARTAELFGFTIRERNMSVILGSAEVTPWELTRAFTVFPNDGNMIEPYIVREALGVDDAVLAEHVDSSRPLIMQKTAEIVREALRAVVLQGTGGRARDIPIELALKTGTTSRESPSHERNETIDAWACGSSIDYTVCIWVGFDTPENIGSQEAGAKTALPIFTKFMERAYADEIKEARKEKTSKELPESPVGIVELEEILTLEDLKSSP